MAVMPCHAIVSPLIRGAIGMDSGMRWAAFGAIAQAVGAVATVTVVARTAMEIVWSRKSIR